MRWGGGPLEAKKIAHIRVFRAASHKGLLCTWLAASAQAKRPRNGKATSGLPLRNQEIQLQVGPPEPQNSSSVTCFPRGEEAHLSRYPNSKWLCKAWGQGRTAGIS